MNIVRLSPSSPRELFLDVARLHAAEIHHGLLPLLGLKFMARMYYELARAPRTGVWAAIESEKLAGFISGCADVSGTYRSMLLKGAIPLGFRALGAMLKPKLLLKLPSLFLYPFRRAQSSQPGNAPASEEKPHAELLSIAVDKSFHRRGIGRQLVVAFESELAEWDVDAYYVTTNREEVASNNFYLSLNFQPVGTIPHHTLVLQQYCKHLGRPTESPAV